MGRVRLGSLPTMSRSSRTRLSQVVRHAGGDLAEAALLVCCELQPEVDVDVELLRLDAIADSLRARDVLTGDIEEDARALASHLHDELGFTGDEADYHAPRNGLLTTVLDRRRGLPIALSIVYVAVGRRLHLPIFGIALAGHFVVGLKDDDHVVVLDPFNGGEVLSQRQLEDLVRVGSAGRIEYRRAMLRPAPTPTVIRRLLNNLTRDFRAQGDVENALWTVELKALLPHVPASDHRDRGELLAAGGRFDEAAKAFEHYLELAGERAPDADEVRTLAIRSKARLN